MSRISDYGRGRIDCAMREGRLSHAVLITGDNYICAETVRYAAALLFGKSETAVEDCADFIRIDGHMLRVQSTEELLSELNVTPNSGKRLISVRNAGYMSVSVQNMLLKTIEEPPQGNYFFLYGNDKGLLPTIRSRCAMLSLGQATDQDIAEYLGNDISREDAVYYARLGGDVETARRMCDDIEYRDFCMNCAALICSVGRKTLFNKFEVISDDVKRATDMFEMALSDMRRIKLGLDCVYFTRAPHSDYVSECAGKLTEKQIDGMCSLVREMRVALFTNVPPKQLFDNFSARTEQVIYD